MTHADGVSLPVPQIAVPERATLKRPKTFKKRFRAMTARRQEVAMLAARGLPNKTIAEKLGLTEGTVKIHLTEIYEILGLRSRIELVMAVAAKLPRMKSVKEDRSLGDRISAA